MARDDEVAVDVVGLGEGPDGLAKFDDYVIFVPGVLPGEQAMVRITSATRKFGRGDMLSLQQESPDRVEPECSHFLTCGGCHRQHQAYPAQLRSKQERLQRSLSFALRDAAPTVEPTVPAPSVYGQRHKVVVHLRNSRLNRGLEACLHKARSPDLVRIHECPASEPRGFALALRTVELLSSLRLRAWHPFLSPDGLMRNVLVRTTTTGEAQVVLVARESEIPFVDDIVEPLHAAGATTIAVNHNDGNIDQLLGATTNILSGPPRIVERLGALTYLISPHAFFQTSPAMAHQLVRRVCEWLAPSRNDIVGDLYCGGGLLTLPLAQLARSAFGIELSTAAIADAHAAAEANSQSNITWHQGHVDRWLSACGGELPRPQLIAMDPPRTGLTPRVIDQLRHLAPRRLAYVSCEPAALQRDLVDLQAAGFVTRRVVPLDMFPGTCHVESLACLEREK